MIKVSMATDTTGIFRPVWTLITFWQQIVIFQHIFPHYGRDGKEVWSVIDGI